MVCLQWKTPETETQTETYKNYFDRIVCRMFILLKDKNQCKFPLGSVQILSKYVLVSVSGSVKELWWKYKVPLTYLL